MTVGCVCCPGAWMPGGVSPGHSTRGVAVLVRFSPDFLTFLLLAFLFLSFLASFFSCLGFHWLEVVGAHGFWAMGLALVSVSWGSTLNKLPLWWCLCGAFSFFFGLPLGSTPIAVCF